MIISFNIHLMDIYCVNITVVRYIKKLKRMAFNGHRSSTLTGCISWLGGMGQFGDAVLAMDVSVTALSAMDFRSMLLLLNF